jgi:hypothetical protein
MHAFVLWRNNEKKQNIFYVRKGYDLAILTRNVCMGTKVKILWHQLKDVGAMVRL